MFLCFLHLEPVSFPSFSKRLAHWYLSRSRSQGTKLFSGCLFTSVEERPGFLQLICHVFQLASVCFLQFKCHPSNSRVQFFCHGAIFPPACLRRTSPR
jgi:hypothetical protein